MYVKFGAHQRYATDEGAVVEQAAEIVLHPSWDSATNVYDFALIKLASSVDFTDEV